MRRLLLALAMVVVVPLAAFEKKFIFPITVELPSISRFSFVSEPMEFPLIQNNRRLSSKWLMKKFGDEIQDQLTTLMYCYAQSGMSLPLNGELIVSQVENHDGLAQRVYDYIVAHYKSYEEQRARGVTMVPNIFVSIETTIDKTKDGSHQGLISIIVE